MTCARQIVARMFANSQGIAVASAIDFDSPSGDDAHRNLEQPRASWHGPAAALAVWSPLDRGLDLDASVSATAQFVR